MVQSLSERRRHTSVYLVLFGDDFCALVIRGCDFDRCLLRLAIMAQTITAAGLTLVPPDVTHSAAYALYNFLLCAYLEENMENDNKGWGDWDDASPTMLFYYAAAQGDVNLVQTLLAQGMSADIVAFDESMLIRAAQFGQVEVARLLLANGANVNYRDPTGYTALTSAVEEGSIEMVNLLLDAGADLTILGGSGAGSALHSAARDGNVEIVRLLLQRGADPNAPDMDGCTVSYLQRFLFLEKRPEVTTQILALLKAAGAK